MTALVPENIQAAAICQVFYRAGLVRLWQYLGPTEARLCSGVRLALIRSSWTTNSRERSHNNIANSTIGRLFLHAKLCI